VPLHGQLTTKTQPKCSAWSNWQTLGIVKIARLPAAHEKSDWNYW
jgi:hypothetical protein